MAALSWDRLHFLGEMADGQAHACGDLCVAFYRRLADRIAAEAAPLDVERLGEAIDNVTRDDYSVPKFRGTHVLAQALAAEYAALAATSREASDD